MAHSNKIALWDLSSSASVLAFLSAQGCLHSLFTPRCANAGKRKKIMTKTDMSPAELWRRGCSNEPLSASAMKRFAAMARSRFHTFEMGINHAVTLSDDDVNENPGESKVEGLINGLASEMAASPGLQKVWHAMAVSKTELGERVNLRLERLSSPLH